MKGIRGSKKKVSFSKALGITKNNQKKKSIKLQQPHQ